MITRLYRTFSVHLSIVQQSAMMMRCQLRALFKELRAQVTSPRKVSSTKKESTICTSQLLASSMMSRPGLSGSTVPFFLTSPVYVQDGERSTRYVQTEDSSSLQI